ncbi:type II and III secretion system protein family protein [Vibrio sp.]|nr:type II and III secretion system protein family protein [Vibrio sp.]
MKNLMIVITILMLWSGGALAAMQTGKVIQVPHHKSAFVQLSGKAKRVSLGDPSVLDIVMMKSDEVFLIGKRLGSTNLMAWDRRGNLIEAIDIEVTHDINSLKAKLFDFLPNEKIEVHSSQNRIVLGGQVSSQERMMMALKIAETYAAGREADKSTDSRSEESSKTNVINLMSIGGAQQVMLEVSVAEVQRSLVRRFGANFNFFEGNGKFGWGATTVGSAFESASDLSSISTIFNDATAQTTGLLSTFLDGDTLFSIALDIAKENGSAKILAEPTLTALSGAKAEFLAGGEFPIPVPNENGITIDYKEYGVGLKFIPTILSDKKINLNLAVDVSEVASGSTLNYSITNSNASYYIPPVTRRSASSTLELADGQTIGIAGMLSENVRDSISKIPGLGDIPILGQLFRSQEYISGETELVILVTPHLAKPIDKSKVRLPTDGYIEPSDVQYYLLGQGAYMTAPNRDKPLEQQASDNYVDSSDGGSEGVFGHDM